MFERPKSDEELNAAQKFNNQRAVEKANESPVDPVLVLPEVQTEQSFTPEYFKQLEKEVGPDIAAVVKGRVMKLPVIGMHVRQLHSFEQKIKSAADDKKNESASERKAAAQELLNLFYNPFPKETGVMKNLIARIRYGGKPREMTVAEVAKVEEAKCKIFAKLPEGVRKEAWELFIQLENAVAQRISDQQVPTPEMRLMAQDIIGRLMYQEGSTGQDQEEQNFMKFGKDIMIALVQGESYAKTLKPDAQAAVKTAKEEMDTLIAISKAKKPSDKVS